MPMSITSSPPGGPYPVESIIALMDDNGVTMAVNIGDKFGHDVGAKASQLQLI